MARRSFVFGAAIGLGVALAGPAGAFDSRCRVGIERWGEAAVSAEVCDLSERDKCPPGPPSARGRMVSEHTWLTRTVMRAAGLDALVEDDDVLRYHGPGEAHPVAGVRSVEPGDTDALRRPIRRAMTIPEFAEVPDVAYSLAGFLLGNEHCPVPALPQDTPEDIARCHDYKLHLGPANSTHFLPQARAMHGLYHGAALQVARRCRALSDAAEAETDPVLRTLIEEEHVPVCEKEALVLEAMAQHFLGDAWSSGHMWERWGSPVLAGTWPGRLRQMALAGVVGMIHGWRSMAKDHGVGDLQHDPLCAAGPHEPFSWARLFVQRLFVERETLERWLGPDFLAGPFTGWRCDGCDAVHQPGAGDHYLLPCTTGHPDRWALMTADALDVQRGRMLSCLAQSLREVYDAGPRTRTDGDPLQIAAPWWDPAVGPSTGDGCWAQRATNISMAVAAGGGVGGVSFVDIESAARVGLDLLRPIPAEYVADVDTVVLQDQLTAIGDQLRKDLVRTSARLQRNLARPLDTDSAEQAATGSFLGYERNSHYVGLITGGRVPYLEAPDAATWATDGGGDCTRDADCEPGAYCDLGGSRTCTPLGAAVVRAFRRGEVAAWCGLDDAEDLDAAAEACQSGDGGCEGCVEALRPHLRHACDAPSFRQWRAAREAAGEPAEGRSLCDALDDAGLVEDRPDDATVYTAGRRELPLDATRLAGELCGSADAYARARASARPPPGAAEVFYDVDLGPPDEAEPLGEASERRVRFTCGAAGGVRWWRFRHEPRAGCGVHVHKFRVRPRPIALDGGGSVPAVSLDDLVVSKHPDCDPDAAAEPENRAYIDEGALTVTWIPPDDGGELCLRVAAADPTVWASYELVLEGPENPDLPCAPPATITADWSNSLARTTYGRMFSRDGEDELLETAPAEPSLADCVVEGLLEPCNLAFPLELTYARGHVALTIQRVAPDQVEIVVDLEGATEVPPLPDEVPEPGCGFRQHEVGLWCRSLSVASFRLELALPLSVPYGPHRVSCSGGVRGFRDGNQNGVGGGYASLEVGIGGAPIGPLLVDVPHCTARFNDDSFFELPSGEEEIVNVPNFNGPPPVYRLELSAAAIANRLVVNRPPEDPGADLSYAQRFEGHIELVIEAPARP